MEGVFYEPTISLATTPLPRLGTDNLDYCVSRSHRVFVYCDCSNHRHSIRKRYYYFPWYSWLNQHGSLIHCLSFHSRAGCTQLLHALCENTLEAAQGLAARWHRLCIPVCSSHACNLSCACSALFSACQTPNAAASTAWSMALVSGKDTNSPTHDRDCLWPSHRLYNRVYQCRRQR